MSQHILIVDDDTWVSQQYSRWCEREGWQARTSPHALQAMDDINDELPSAIVLDVFLPGVNALVLLHELQSYPDTADIPVVLCTSSAREFDGVDMSKYGIRDILDKTDLTRHDFLRSLRRVLA